jgi:DNA (cytosine-5)-methyltransferase 1
MRVLDLFSGIGGFSLGLERAGMRTVAFCEIEPYCRAVLAERWPGVPCFGDIRGINSYELGRLGGVDLICGGFPCQDISYAGAGAGITGERSGLWREYARVIGLVRPRYVVVENVSALLNRGLGEVLGDLAAIGYDAEWHCIPASYVGAPHRRDRIWIIAYPESSNDWGLETVESDGQIQQSGIGPVSPDVADSSRLQPGRPQQRSKRQRTRACAEPAQGSTQWLIEPDVGRVANGVPARVDRLKALGNAVVPQIPEIIGRAIMRQCLESNTEGKSDVR